MDAALLVDHLHTPPSHATENAGVTVRVLLTLSAHAAADRARAPLALALVLDRSGSMDGDRLDAARRAAVNAVARLHPTDVVSAVVFDGRVSVLAEPAPRARQHQLASRLRDVEARGATNLSGGWLRGRRHMEEAIELLPDSKGASRRIVVLTDGHANAGITNPATLVELARTARAHGITTTTVGIGEGYDDGLLRAMADAGGGNAWYVERAEQAQDVLAEELGNLLSIAAQGVTVTLLTHASVQMLTVHSDWPVTQSVSGMQFDLGDLYASEPKPLLLELFVPHARLDGLAAADATPDALPSAALQIASLRIAADVLTPDGGVEHRVMVLPLAASLAAQSTMHPDIERAVVLARIAKAREVAAQRQRDGDVDGAAAEMDLAAAVIASSPLSLVPEYAEELLAHATDLTSLGDRYRTRRHSELDAKYQMQRSYNAKRGKQHYDEIISRSHDGSTLS